MIDKLEEKFTKYEVARILGARSLQLAMDAPILLKMSKSDEEELNFDTLKIAEKELEAEVLPITVKRPLPKKSEKSMKKLSDKEIQEKLEKQKEIKKIEESKEQTEEKDEEEIKQQSDIMEMATPEDEVEQESTEEREEA